MPVKDHDNLPNVGLVFDEQNLRTDIIRVWGEHGAHIDVFDHMLRLCQEQAIKLDQARIDIDELRAALAARPQADAEVERLRADITELRVQLIVARNPGIDPDEVRATLPPWREAVAESATPTHRDEAGNEWITPAEDMWQDDDVAAAGPAAPTGDDHE